MKKEVKLEKQEMFNAYEPKQCNRWVVTFPEHFGIESWMVNHVTPVIYDAENRKWENITVTLVDAIPKSSSKALSDLIQKGTMYNFLLKMTILGPVGDEIEDYYFEECNFKTINFGETNYQKKELKYIKLLISYKKCVVS